MEVEEKTQTATIIVKYLPKPVKEMSELLQQLRPVPQALKPFGRRRVLLIYATDVEAQQALAMVRSSAIFGTKTTANIFQKHPPKAQKGGCAKSHKVTQTKVDPRSEAALPLISKYVREVYAMDAALDFNQPPPAYLKYAYPPITKDIMDAICIALMSNVRFYTQVLHLMNRMNLEPPFGPRNDKCARSTLYRDVASQTEEAYVGTINKQSETESELESSEDELQKVERKRKLEVVDAQYKKKARQLLQAHKQAATLKIGSTTKKPNQPVFEENIEVKTPKIQLKLQPKTKPTEEPFAMPPDLGSTQLSASQMQELPIFQNYQRGTPSNKLYIKNLSKTVTQNDVLGLYSRYVALKHLDVKLMQQGRMKGQAFVSFCDLPATESAAIVAKALEETNGFVLRGKPIVVCYGKQ